MNRGELSGLGVLFKYAADAAVVRRLPGPRAARQTVNKVRIGVIGAGNYASSMLLPILASDRNVRLVEVVTNSALSAANAAKKFGFDRMSTDWDGLLRADDIDAVLIATRHATHSDLVCAALRNNKAVFVEKPLAIERDSIIKIVNALEESGNERLMVGFNRRFSPFLTQLKSDWGKRTGHHIIHYRINAGPLEKGSWYSQSDSEGSRFAGEGGHFIDTVNWWLDAEPVRVSAAATIGDIDNLTATLIYPDGSIATISYLTEGDAQLSKERIEIFGEGKAACFENFERFDLWRGGNALKRKASGIDKGQKQQLKAFVAAVKSGGVMPIGLGSLLTTTAATLATQESIAMNKPVEVTSDWPAVGYPRASTSTA
jgi:predicted dehydrogenase